MTAAAAGAVAAAGAALLVLGLLLRVPALVAPAAGALGAAYALTRVAAGGSPDLHAPLVAVTLLLVCELAYWAHELRTTSPDEPGAVPRHLAWLALLAVATFVPGAVLLAIGDLLRVEGIAVEAAGAVAAAALLGAVLLLVPGARRGS